MSKYYSQIPFYSLLVALMFFTSCNGQTQTDLPKEKEIKSNSIPKGQSKLIKTQGTNENANVHCGLQDKGGNLWFGTTGEGVYRYNGKSFINFTDTDGLSSNNVFSILEDKTGNIWFGTDAGICRYDGKTITGIPMSVTNGSNFYPINPSSNKPSENNAVWSMLQDKSGKIWFGTRDDGVYCYNGTFFTHFLHNDSVVNKSGLHLKAINSILEDKTGKIWFATWFEGVCRYDGKSITSFKPNGEVWFANIFEDQNGNIWAGRRYKGVTRYDGSTFINVLQNGIFDSATVRPYAEDKLGNIWFGTEHEGVWRYDGKSFKNFTMKDGLSNNSVFCIVADRDNNIWIGTRNTGLYKYDGIFFTRLSE